MTSRLSFCHTAGCNWDASTIPMLHSHANAAHRTGDPPCQLILETQRIPACIEAGGSPVLGHVRRRAPSRRTSLMHMKASSTLHQRAAARISAPRAPRRCCWLEPHHSRGGRHLCSGRSPTAPRSLPGPLPGMGQQPTAFAFVSLLCRGDVVAESSLDAENRALRGCSSARNVPFKLPRNHTREGAPRPCGPQPSRSFVKCPSRMSPSDRGALSRGSPMTKKRISEAVRNKVNLDGDSEGCRRPDR